MALKTTPTIAICVTAGIAAGIALARPGDQAAPLATPVDAAAPAATIPAGGYGTPDATPPAPAAVPAPTPATITIQDFAFAGTTAVTANAPITVTNLDGAPHTLSATDGAFDTGNLDGGDSVTITAPTTPGSYAFFCAIHPSMTGTLVVS